VNGTRHPARLVDRHKKNWVVNDLAATGSRP
jgi:hypothetical protein